VRRLFADQSLAHGGPAHSRLRHLHDIVVMDIVNDHVIVSESDQVTPNFYDFVMRALRHAGIRSEID